MISIIDNNIISTIKTIEKKIFTIKSYDILKKGSSIEYKIEGNLICVITSGTIIAALKQGVLFDLLVDILKNERYRYKSTLKDFDREDDYITVSIEVFRYVDIEKDPYVLKNEFTLIKTTKKDNSISRQNSYYSTNEMEFLKFSSIGESVYVRNQKNQILGELGTKGVSFINGHSSSNLFCKLIKKNRNDSGNYIGIVRFYEVMR